MGYKSTFDVFLCCKVNQSHSNYRELFYTIKDAILQKFSIVNTVWYEVSVLVFAAYPTRLPD